MSDQLNLHILIAEDDLDDAEIIEECFKNHPAFVKVTLVNNGKQLLDYLTDPEKIKPDVILTDINMPVLNGIEALEKIHINSEFKKIPAFVYSSAINPVYRDRCMKLGTKGFVEKPYNLNEFHNIPLKIISVLTQQL